MIRSSARFMVGVFFAATASAAPLHEIDWSGPADVRLELGARELSLLDGVRAPGAQWPARIVRVEIPPGMRVAGASIAPRQEDVLPGPGAQYRAAAASGTEPTLDVRSAWRGTSAGYTYWRLPEGDFRGHRIAHLLVCPFREEDGSLRVLRRFAIELALEPAETSALERRIRHPRTEASDQRELRAILDAEPAGANSPPLADGSRVQMPELGPEVVEYVIITNTEMAGVYQELADYKSREGLPAIVTTVEWIVDNYPGNDLAARMRNYLRDLYLYQGLRYALLGGDTGQVPIRFARSRFQAPQGLSVATDKYFACLDGDWNADGDNALGEAPDTLLALPGDDVDLYPEISIGRAPTSSAAEAAGFIAKWKSYTGYDRAHFRDDYQMRILSLGEVLIPPEWTPGDDPGVISLDGADICESTLTFVPPYFERTRMYQYADNPEYPGALPEIKDSVVVRINEGYAIIDHVGHGFRTHMSVGDGKLGNQDADLLANEDAYSILYAVNCTSGAVDYDCIVEHLMMNASGGMVGAVASTNLDYPTVSDTYKHRFFQALFQQGTTALGDAAHLADLPSVPVATLAENADRWTIMTLITMGDPALEIWTAPPDTLELAYAPTMALGAGSFTVGVSTVAGGPVQGARVTLWKEDGYGVGVTNASGTASIAFLPATTGAFRITAVKNSSVPAVDSALVVSPATAALRVSGWAVRDGIGGGGTGNGDGRPDVGESVVVDLTIRNDGSSPATGVQAVLHAPGPGLVVTDSTASTGTIGAGQAAFVSGAFAFAVSTGLPDTLRHVVVPATIRLSSAQGAWTEERRFSIYQRILDVIALDWTIPDDDGDGTLESGETAEVFLTVKNEGEAEAVDVVGVGTYTGTEFVMLDDTIPFGNIGPGAAVEDGPIRLLSIGGGSPDLAFHLALSDDHAASILSRTLDVVAPAPPDTVLADPASSSILLSWPPDGAPDVRGYRVFRSPNGIAYAEVSGGIVEGGSFYSDEGLPPLTSFWYRVASVDSSGNASQHSISVRVSTSPPLLEGWPVDLPSGESKGSPGVADLDWNGDMEIVLGWNYPMVFRHDGGDFIDGDNDALTPGIFSTIEQGLSKFWTAPAASDLDQDGVLEIVFCAWQTTGTGHMYVLDATGAVEPGWPRELGLQPWSTAAVGDVDGDGDEEIFVSSGSGSIGSTYQGVLFGFHHDGAEIIDGDATPSTHGIFYKSSSTQARFLYGSPGLADLDDDGREEIIFLEKTVHTVPSRSSLYVFEGDGNVRTGFPYAEPTLMGSTSSPAVADLDGDGSLEIVCVTEDRIFVVKDDATLFNGWPVLLTTVPSGETAVRDFLSSPAIGDVNLDGRLDVALGWLNGRVYLWTGDGAIPHPGFPVDVGESGGSFERYMRSPVLGNIDADPRPEIVVGSGANRLYAINHDGTQVGGFPLVVPGTVYGAPLLWDVDGDGSVNLVVQTDAPVLEVYDFTAVPFVPSQHPWPMFRHDHRKTGWLAVPPVVATGPDPVSPAPPGAAMVHPARPNPFAPRVEIPFDVPGGGGPVRIRVFDVQGREVRRLADGTFPAGRFRVSWDGRTEHGVSLGPGIYFARVEIGSRTFVQKLVRL